MESQQNYLVEKRWAMESVMSVSRDKHSRTFMLFLSSHLPLLSSFLIDNSFPKFKDKIIFCDFRG